MTESQGPNEFEAGGAERVARQQWLGVRETEEAPGDVQEAAEGVDPAEPGDTADEPAGEPQESADPRESAEPDTGITMPAVPKSGDPRVDAVVAPLQHLGEESTEEHVSAYEAAHGGLQDLLADLDRDTDGD